MTISLVGILFAQMVFGMLGVLAFSGEYGTGMIRATLAVVPSRLPVLWAKVIVLAGVMLPLTLLAAPGVTVINDGTNLLRVSGTTAEQVGTAAWRAHLPVYELTPTHASLEEAFMQVTQDSIEYHAGATR